MYEAVAVSKDVLLARVSVAGYAPRKVTDEKEAASWLSPVDILKPRLLFLWTVLTLFLVVVFFVF